MTEKQKNREVKTLSKLTALKNYITQNPEAKQYEWYQNVGLSRAMVDGLIKHGIIKNSGTRHYAKYYWDGPIPNIRMAQRLIEYQSEAFERKFAEPKPTKRQYRRANRVVVATTEVAETSNRLGFLEAILSVSNEFVVNGFNVAINENNAVISRNNESMTFTEPTMLTKVFKLVSE